MTSATSIWRDRHVAVTGATGLLGSHLVPLLLAEGAEVVVLWRDRRSPAPLVDAWWPEVSVVHGDLRDGATVERLVHQYEVRTVFHLGAQSQVRVANAAPRATLEANINGTWNVLEAARTSPYAPSVIVASSDKAYGSNPVLPYTEEHPLLACHPYDASKAAADVLARTYANTYGMRLAVTRCGNLFGPGDLNWDRLVPGTLRLLLRGQAPVIRSDGSLLRDYLYVADAAAWYLRLAEALVGQTDLSGRAFNMSTGEVRSVLEVVEVLQRAVGTSFEPVIENAAPNEIEQQWLDSTAIRSALGWAPSTSFEEAVAATVEWYRQVG